jgi:hypothetical protein
VQDGDLEAKLVAGEADGGTSRVDAAQVDLEALGSGGLSSQMPAAWARPSAAASPASRAPREMALEEPDPVTFLMATRRPAGSCSSTRSTRTNGYWVGICRMRPAMSMEVAFMNEPF